MEEIKNLREEREDLKLTQQDVAIMLGVGRVSYLNWENEPETMPLGKYLTIIKKFEELRKLRDL